MTVSLILAVTDEGEKVRELPVATVIYMMRKLLVGRPACIGGVNGYNVLTRSWRWSGGCGSRRRNTIDLASDEGGSEKRSNDDQELHNHWGEALNYKQAWRLRTDAQHGFYMQRTGRYLKKFPDRCSPAVDGTILNRKTRPWGYVIGMKGVVFI